VQSKPSLISQMRTSKDWSEKRQRSHADRRLSRTGREGGRLCNFSQVFSPYRGNSRQGLYYSKYCEGTRTKKERGVAQGEGGCSWMVLE